MSAKSNFRQVLGQFATGITIITTHHDGEPYGFTANSFTSVSLDPKLVLFCIKKNANFLEACTESGSFAINILSEAQEDLSNKFANPMLSSAERFHDVGLLAHDGDNPILAGALAYLDCEVKSISDAGDHQIIVGEVQDYQIASEGSPLIYFSGRYRTLNSEVE